MTQADITIPVENWQAFTTLVHRFVGPGAPGNYVFRGEECAAWTLTPKLHRSCTDREELSLPEVTQLLAIEKLVTNRFKAAAPIHLPPALLPDKGVVFMWWPIMQHYGVPTRLLDWTESPYVAAYFACRGMPKDDGAVYFVHNKSLREKMIMLHGEDIIPLGLVDDWEETLLAADAPPVIYLLAQIYGLADRMLSQQGVFMLCRNVAADIHTTLFEALTAVPSEERTVGKILIPAAQKSRFMGFLRTMNLTASSLFPGLDGVGRAIDEFVRARQLIP